MSVQLSTLKMKNSSLLILEIIWIVVGLFCIAAGIRSAILTGGYHFLIFLIMAVISFGFAWVRHSQRKKS
jgi:hypothetical protein